MTKLRVAGCLVVGAVLFFCGLTSGATFLATGPFTLLFGWVPFALDAAERVRPSPGTVATVAGCAVAILGGGHFFARWLRREMRPLEEPWRLRWTLSIGAIATAVFGAGISAVGVVHQTAWLATSPEPLIQGGSRSRVNEVNAIGALRTIGLSQEVFREQDKERDGVLDYGTLEELAAADLVDPILGAGTKQGYFFVVGPSTTTPELRWFAAAGPAIPGTTGKRWFFANGGVIYYSVEGPIRFDRATCAALGSVVPIGR